MTAPIIGPAPAPAHAAEAAAKKTKDNADIKQAAAAFEAILVRQLLGSAKVAGKGNYSDMGVEALSTAVTQGGGLGLGRAIENAIRAEHPAAPGATPGPENASNKGASKE